MLLRCRRMLLLVPPCVLLAMAMALPNPVPAGPEAGKPGLPAGGGPGDGKLFPGSAFDGHFSLGMDYPLSVEHGGIGSRGMLLARWNPSFLGWDARLAAGGIFWQSPSVAGSAGPHTRLAKFSGGLDEAWLRYPFRAAPWAATFQAGIFRWRSHADAALAGEYLARWGAYPVHVIRPDGGFEPPDSLTTRFVGLRLALAAPGRIFGQEILAVLDKRPETAFLTVIGSTTLAPLPGIEAGIGAAYHEPMDSPDAYTYDYPAGRVYGQPDTGDGTDEPAWRRATLEFRTLTFSVRLTADAATWITGASRPDRGGRLYAEAAMLGWKDYPYFYYERSRRVQFCAGLNLPTFGVLDALRLQAERRSYPLADNPFNYSSAVAATLPGSWWIGRAHLSRSLLPWLEAHVLALWNQGPEGRDPAFFFAPVADAEARPRSDVAGWAWEARITARL